MTEEAHTLTWSDLTTVLDEMQARGEGLSPKECRFTEAAILCGLQRMGQAEVRAYSAPVSKEALTEGEFRLLTEKLRAAAERLPAEERTLARDAFFQGVSPIEDDNDVQGYVCLTPAAPSPLPIPYPATDGGGAAKPVGGLY